MLTSEWESEGKKYQIKKTDKKVFGVASLCHEKIQKTEIYSARIKKSENYVGPTTKLLNNVIFFLNTKRSRETRIQFFESSPRFIVTQKHIFIVVYVMQNGKQFSKKIDNI